MLDRAQFDNFYSKMSQINGYIKCWNVMIMFHIMFGERMLQSNITRVFVWYLKLLGSEPFIDHADGNIELNCDDASVTLRVKLYIRCIWEEMNGKLEIDVLNESFEYLFMNPQRNTIAMKDFKAVLINCAFTKSVSGSILSWTDASLTSFILSDPPSVNKDTSTYIRHIAEIRESLNIMKQLGLVYLARRLNLLLGEDINYESVSDYSTFWFLEALSGYMRSNFTNMAKNSIIKASANRFPRPNNLIKQHLYKLWFEVLDDWVKQMPDTQEEYVLEMYSDLTTKSNGLNDFIYEGGKWVETEDGNVDNVGGERIPNPMVTSVPILDDSTGGKPVHLNWKFTDKAMTFRKHTKELLDRDRMMNSLTYDDPGRFFERVVPARKKRKVYGVPIYRFLTERHVRSGTTYLSKILYEGEHTSTLAIDTGRYMTEMGKYLFETAHPERNTKTLLADFGSFDETQCFEEFRAVQIKAAQDVHKLHETELQSYKFELLQGRDPLENLIDNWSTMVPGVFKVYTTSRRYVLLSTGWLLSGEFSTLLSNTISNMAFMRTVLDYLSVTASGLNDGLMLSDYIHVMNYKLQGDDQISVVEYRKPLTIEQMTIIEDEFIKLLYLVAGSAGLDLSKNKTELRQAHFEFLKKAGIFGYAVPRYLQITLEEAEEINRTQDPIERMRARIGQFREWIFRGGRTDNAIVRLHLEWIITKKVKSHTSLGEFEDVHLPFPILWTPVSDGGVGMLPTTIVDPNVDIMISIREWSPIAYTAINRCIAAIKHSIPKNIGNIVDQVKEVLKDGMEFESKLDHTIHSEKILAAEQAMRYLKEFHNMPTDRSAYHLRYEKEVEEAIEEDRKMAVINIRWKERRAKEITYKFLELNSENLPYEDYLSQKFVPGVKYVFTNDIINKNLPICPVAGLDLYLQEWFKQIGTTSEEKIIIGDSLGRLSSLLNKGNFPRNLKANSVEAIAKSLLRYNCITLDSIQQFLIMRGAEANASYQVAASLVNNIDMLRYLSDVSAFSFVGEGFTDKSAERINELVEFANPELDNTTPLAKMIKAVGYQFMRTDILWNDDRTVKKRRYVKILTDSRTSSIFLEKSISEVAQSSISSEQLTSILTELRNVSFSSLFA